MTLRAHEWSPFCPTCGLLLPDHRKGVRVDLDSNTAVIDGSALRLQPRHAELLSVLSNAMPRYVRREALFRALWGFDEPENAVNALAVHISLLRKQLKNFGYTIKSPYGRGLALARETAESLELAHAR